VYRITPPPPATIIHEQLSQYLLSCGYKEDIVKIVRGDKEKGDLMGFTDVPLPSVVLGESGEVEYKTLSYFSSVDYIEFENGTAFKGQAFEYKQKYEIYILTLDMMYSRDLALIISAFINRARFLTSPSYVYNDGGSVVGVVEDMQRIEFLTTELNWTHEPLKEESVYKLSTEIELKITGSNYIEVPKMGIARDYIINYTVLDKKIEDIRDNLGECGDR
jgi:hypothetical protein